MVLAYEQRLFYGRSIISEQHRNSSNLGQKTRVSCVRGRTRKLRPRKHFFEEGLAEGLAEAHVFRNSGYAYSSKPCRGSRSQNSAEKTFAEAAAEGGSKKDYKRYSRKGFAQGVVSVVESYRNENHSSYRRRSYPAFESTI